MPETMMNYRRNEKRLTGRLFKGILDEDETGLLRPKT
jgi:hypothetical protein